eukprot:4238671-Pyramimonas_sp.AAC.1
MTSRSRLPLGAAASGGGAGCAMRCQTHLQPPAAVMLGSQGPHMFLIGLANPIGDRNERRWRGWP